jgi:putative flippase GtrA
VKALEASIGTAAARYLIAGAVNSLVTFLLYLALLTAFPYPVAYSVSYAAGIVFSFILNSRLVFRVPLRWRRLLAYPSVYLAQYLLGLAVIYFGVEAMGRDERWMPVVAAAITVPVSFVLSRWILRGGRRGMEGEGSGPQAPAPRVPDDCRDGR